MNVLFFTTCLGLYFTTGLAQLLQHMPFMKQFSQFFTRLGPSIQNALTLQPQWLGSLWTSWGFSDLEDLGCELVTLELMGKHSTNCSTVICYIFLIYFHQILMIMW